MSIKGQPLFLDTELREVLESKKVAIRNEILRFDKEYIIKASESDLISYFISKYSVDELILLKELEQAEMPLDVDVDIREGTLFIFEIPFKGDRDLFRYKPSTFTYNPPNGRIVDNKLIIKIVGVNLSPEQLKREHDQEVEKIEKYLGWISKDVTKYNDSLQRYVENQIKSRKEKILSDDHLVASLGIPLKRSKEGNLTYNIPEIKRKIKFQPPIVSKEPFTPEPELSIEEYDYIIRIIGDMVTAMERSPKTFSKLEEEELRDFLLVQLNAHYEGKATGETFNANGKTDIYISVNEKNAFIAECKFWHGKKGYSSTIDQLLGYLCWRDTKTAIIIFNKNQNFSEVLEKIKDATVEHPNFKKELEPINESTFRYLFHQNNDKNREIYITILAFNVPVEQST